MRLWVINLKQIIIIIIINYNNDMLPDLYFKISRLKKKKRKLSSQKYLENSACKASYHLSKQPHSPPNTASLITAQESWQNMGRDICVYICTHTHTYTIYFGTHF